MQGSVWERYPGSWWYKFDIGRDANGKRQRVQQGGFKTKREANQAKIEAMARYNAGAFVAPSTLTLATFLENDWLPAMEGKTKHSSFVSTKRIVQTQIIPQLGGVKMSDLARSPQRVVDFYKYLVTRGRADKKGGLSAKSVRNTHVVLRSALQYALRKDLISRNVAAIVSPSEAISAAPTATTKKAPRVMKTWTAEELGTFLSSVQKHPLYVAFHTAANTGMRRGELLGLRWNDVRLDEGTLSVRQTLLSVDYKLVFDTPKSKKSRRPITLDADTISLLRSHRLAQKEQRLAMGLKVKDDDLVFACPDGTPIHPESFSDAFEVAVKRSGLPRLTCHDLRHTHASLALAAGVHPKIVSERLGHASIEITLNTYSHLIPSLDKDAAELIAGLIPKTTAPKGDESKGTL